MDEFLSDHVVHKSSKNQEKGNYYDPWPLKINHFILIHAILCNNLEDIMPSEKKPNAIGQILYDSHMKYQEQADS